MKILLVPVLIFLGTICSYGQCDIPINITLRSPDPCKLWLDVQRSYAEASIRMATFDYITDNTQFVIPLYEDGIPLTVIQHPTLFNGFTGKFDINVVNGVQVPTVQYAGDYNSAYNLLDHEMAHWLWWKRYVWYYPKFEYNGIRISELYTRDWYLFIGHGNTYDPFVGMLNLAIQWFSNIPSPSNYNPGRLPSK